MFSNVSQKNLIFLKLKFFLLHRWNQKIFNIFKVQNFTKKFFFAEYKIEFF